MLNSKGDHNSKIVLTNSFEQDLGWWKIYLPNAENDILQNVFALEIFYDSFNLDWGIFCNGEGAEG